MSPWLTPHDHTDALTGRRLGLFEIVALCLALVGCGDEARFDATLSVDNGCLQDFFPFEPNLFAASNTDEGTLIRMQRDSRARTRADAFYITFASDSLLGDCPDPEDLAGSSVEVAPGQCVQAFFRINESCRSRYFNLMVTGTLTLDEIGFGRYDSISGSITGTIEDVKTGEIAGEPVTVREPVGTVTGDFSFDVEYGESYQLYWPREGPELRD